MDPIRLIVFFVVCSYALIASEGILSSLRGMFSPKQMQSFGGKTGMPWLTHGGAFFGDAFLVTPTVAYLIYRCGASWHPRDHLLQIGIVWAINIGFHWMWARQQSPDCLACFGRLTPAGYPHFLYMGLSLTLVVLLYFDTTVPIDPAVVIAVSLIFAFHLLIGSHAVPSIWNILADHMPNLGLQRLSWWKVNTLKDPGALIALLGCWAALYFRTRWMIAHH